jgi:hypothetical protein
MPNPYHDGNGRFCSKGEMRRAVDTAAASGDFNAYFALRKDFEAASGGSYEHGSTVEKNSDGTAFEQARQEDVKKHKNIDPDALDTHSALRNADHYNDGPGLDEPYISYTQVDQEEVREAAGSARFLVESLQQKGIVVTKDDAEKLKQELKDTYSKGYKSGDSMERTLTSIPFNQFETSLSKRGHYSFDAQLDSQSYENIVNKLEEEFRLGEKDGGWDY